MKFSILLPTRNRLELLKIAIHSIQGQDYSNWEVIVSDNYSEEDVAGYVQSLNDPRIKYYRTESFVPVTENWNNALEKSSGDYVIMLGDDDCLMKGYFTAVCKLLEDYPDPDFIYTSGFLYAYPNVMPWCSEGFLSAFGNASFLESKRKPYWLKREEALKLVDDSMNFKVMFAYNVQYSILSRHLIEKMQAKGKFYQTSYPDYYTMTALMLEAKKILACPWPLVMVGISPKSFGFFHFNQREKEAAEFIKMAEENLEQPQLQKTLLPGTKMNTYWLFSMEALKNNYNEEYDLSLNYGRYRWLQIIKVYRKWTGQDSWRSFELKELWKRMTVKEKIAYGLHFQLVTTLLRCLPMRLRNKIANRLEKIGGSHPTFKSEKIEGVFPTALQVFEQIDPQQYKL